MSDDSFGAAAVEGVDDAIIEVEAAAAAEHTAPNGKVAEEIVQNALTSAIGVSGTNSVANSETEQRQPPKKKRKTAGQNRVRRVGRVPTRSAEELLAAANQEPHHHQQQQQLQPPSPESITLGEAATVAAAAVMETPPPAGALFKVHSKHDEKWNEMFNQLVEYKKHFKTTNVPQCYDKNMRLGRWTHYQRVEYWLYQSKGKAKINPQRIARLESIGFEWDPQRAQWEKMFGKLQVFHREHGHSKVPKGFTRDPELANWVRNQRLEYSNMQRGKKTRMTQKRLERLEALGFKWSSSKASSKPSEQTTTTATTTNSSVEQTTEESQATKETKADQVEMV